MLNKLKYITIRNNLMIQNYNDLFEILKGILIYKHNFELNNYSKNYDLFFKEKTSLPYFERIFFKENFDSNYYINDYFINNIQLKIREFIINQNDLNFFQLQLILKTLIYFNNNKKKINNNFISKLVNSLENFLINNNINIELKYELIIDFLEKIKYYNLIKYEFFETLLYFWYYNINLLKDIDKIRYLNICYKFNFLLSETRDIIINLNINYIPNSFRIKLVKFLAYYILKNKIDLNENYNENEIIKDNFKEKLNIWINQIIKEKIKKRYLFELLLIKYSLNDYFENLNNLKIDKNKLNLNKIENYNYFEFEIKKHLDYLKIEYEFQILIEDFISVDFFINFPHKKVIIETNGPIHYYKETNMMTSKTQFKTMWLKKLNYIIINISYEDWYKNKGIGNKNKFWCDLIFNNLQKNKTLNN